MARVPSDKLAVSGADLKLKTTVDRAALIRRADAEPADIKEFEDGYVPKGQVVKLKHQPVVLRFSPSAYRPVEPKELKEWHQEVADRLGGSFDIGPGFGGTISFCERGGSGAAYRCDSDIEAADRSAPDQKSERLKPWSSKPIVLDFPPVAYEVVEPSALKDWSLDLQKQFGLDFDIVGPGGGGGTISFCERGGSGAAYRCDSDIA